MAIFKKETDADLYGLEAHIDPDQLFTDVDGKRDKGVEATQRKYLKVLEPALGAFLDEGEKILCITQGQSPITILERLLTGAIIFYIKRSLFVFTDKRIFHVPTTAFLKYRNSIAQILYADCKEISFSWGRMVVKYQSGKTESFYAIGRSEVKKIEELLTKVDFGGQQSRVPARTHLCPRCTYPLEAGTYECPSCHLAFKSRTEALRVSVIFPGGGYFYTGHPFLGIQDAFAETVLLGLTIMTAYWWIAGQTGIFLPAMFAVLLILEKAITVYHSNHFVKEFIPKEKDITPQPRGLPAKTEPREIGAGEKEDKS